MLEASSRMLLLSSARVTCSSESSFAASSAIRSKNDVGGSCFGSPTITACPPRASAPTASSGRICEASVPFSDDHWTLIARGHLLHELCSSPRHLGCCDNLKNEGREQYGHRVFSPRAFHDTG